MIKRIVDLTVIPLFYLTAFPICCLIAFMDMSNGRGFKRNLKEVMGFGFKSKKKDSPA